MTGLGKGCRAFVMVFSNGVWNGVGIIFDREKLSYPCGICAVPPEFYW
jgi:hypothetical protein